MDNIQKLYYAYVNNSDSLLQYEQAAREFIERYINCLDTNPSRFIEAIPNHLVLEVSRILEEAGIKDEGIWILLNDRKRINETYGN